MPVTTLSWSGQLTGTLYASAGSTLANWEPIGTTTSSTLSFTTVTGWPPEWPASLGGGLLVAPYAPPRAELTDQERAAFAVRRRERRGQREEKARAQDRAVELLRQLLTPDQLAQYELDGAFEVQGSAGGRYRIRQGASGNVRLLGLDGAEVAALCAHPQLDVYRDDGEFAGHLPVADVAVGQMLLLQTDEREFHRRANVHWREAGFDAAMRQLVAA